MTHTAAIIIARDAEAAARKKAEAALRERETAERAGADKAARCEGYRAATDLIDAVADGPRAWDAR